MSTVILTNWTVYYAADTGAGGGLKQIRWTGGATGTNSVNELYSALMNLFDNSTHNGADDSIPLKAVTPTQYEIGIFDAGDKRPWYIDPESVKHLTGGGINSNSWTRVVNSNAGIVKVSYSVGAGAQFVASDVGLPITYADGDAGVLLAFNTTSSTAWIRPNTSAAANNFDASPTASGNLAVTGGTGSVTQTAPAASGECIWSNIYTLGTIEASTMMYVYQSQAALSSWWSTGHIDLLVLIKDFGSLIDIGQLTVYARQYTKLYDHYTLNVASGGRTPIPLATSADINNATGYLTFTGNTGSNTFNAGNYIYVGSSWAAATVKGILTAVGGTTANPILTYYLVGNFTDFAAGNDVVEYDPATGANGDATCKAGAPAATVNGPTETGVNKPSTITATFGPTSQNLLNGSGARPYSVIIDCQQVPLAEVYERLKYITRRGETGDIDAGSQTLYGQEYVGIGDIRLPYSSQSTSFVAGETVNQVSGATGIVTADHNALGFLILRSVRGTFQNGENIRSGSTVRAVAGTSAAISPVKQSPFGTFAGGKFFGAPGVWLTNYRASEATKYELIDSLGVRQVPPITISIELTGIVQDTQCYIYPSAGGPAILNATASTPVSGNQYKAVQAGYTYTGDVPVSIRAREMGYLPFETTSTVTNADFSITAVWQTDPNWKLEVSGETINFTNATGVIHRGTGDFAADGWLSVMGQVTITGSASNNGTHVITNVSGADITVSGTLSNETSTKCTLTFTRIPLT